MDFDDSFHKFVAADVKQTHVDQFMQGGRSVASLGPELVRNMGGDENGQIFENLRKHTGVGQNRIFK